MAFGLPDRNAVAMELKTGLGNPLRRFHSLASRSRMNSDRFSVPVVSELAIDARCSASAPVKRNVILILPACWPFSSETLASILFV